MDYFTFDFFIVYPAPCLGSYANRLLFTAMLPLCLIAGVLLVAWVAQLVVRWRTRGSVTTGTNEQQLNDDSNFVIVYGIPMALFIGFCSFAPISTFIFQVFDCRSFQLDSVDKVSHRFLHIDLQMRCNDRHGGYESAEYSYLVGVAAGMIVLWPVGFTVVCIIGLYISRKNVTLGRRTRMSHAFRFVFQEYKPIVFWWEILEIIRRLFLAGFVLGIPEEHSLMRLVAGQLASLLYACLLMLVRPYRRDDDNTIAISSNLHMVIAFIVAILIKLFEDLRVEFRMYTSVEKAFKSTVQSLGFDSSFVISMVLCTPQHCIARPLHMPTYLRARSRGVRLASPTAWQGR